MPHTYDQYYWGGQVERLNIGCAAKSVTAETLAETLELSGQAAKLSAQVRADGARNAAERLMALQIA